MRVFLDAIVLFSAAKSDGAVRALVRLLLDRGHECWADAYVLVEARRNLVNKGPAAVPVLDALLAHLQIAPTLVGAAGAGDLDWLPPKDLDLCWPPPFACAAMRSSPGIGRSSAAHTD
jgi:hypothetical protein